jgi:hypothetical protein
VAEPNSGGCATFIESAAADSTPSPSNPSASPATPAEHGAVEACPSHDLKLIVYTRSIELARVGEVETETRCAPKWSAAVIPLPLAIRPDLELWLPVGSYVGSEFGLELSTSCAFVPWATTTTDAGPPVVLPALPGNWCLW